MEQMGMQEPNRENVPEREHVNDGEGMLAHYCEEGLEALLAIIRSPGEKTADRIAAAKVLIDLGMKDCSSRDDGAVRVIMENVPGEYLL